LKYLFCALPLLLSISVSHAQTKAKHQRFTVYVSAPVREGFFDTNKGIEDSIKDIRGQLSGMREITVVDSQDKADVVLTVIGRGVGFESYGQRLSYVNYFGYAELYNVPLTAQTYWISSVMQVGNYKKEFVGIYTRTQWADVASLWGRATNQITKSVQAWIKTNTMQLLTVRP